MNIKRFLPRLRKASPAPEPAWTFNGSQAVTEAKIAERHDFIKPAGNTVVIDPIISLKDDESPIGDKLRAAGANTGNMLFVSAVKEQVDIKDVIWFNGRKLHGYEVYGGAVAVIPASNFLNPGSDSMIDAMKSLYEHTKCNITMAGLGAQSSSEYDTPKKLVEALGENKITFFRRAAQRAVSLGVRGEFTAECLEIMGIHNYRIIGCPTAYRTLDGSFAPLPAPSAQKTLISVTGRSEHESRLLEMGMRSRSEMIMQMATEIPDLTPVDTAFPGCKASVEQYNKYVSKHGHIFFDMDKWNRYLRESGFTFAYGSRFHGNMAAFRSGIPALWLTHDSRTSELVQTLHLPHIPISKAAKYKYAEDLLEFCDYSSFAKNSKKLTEEYVRYLEENGISHKFRLEGE
ncbi:MAG: polysaccharide pyruvyl transferase family protein [Oscillospiraceae bacterium]|nr:polysaccharide pyruvyl transferase family protein [Oscillospiraceae bacterium]MBQ8978806.1 polysaccharide pyruvyl transferase family protein [Oscillospiraceae bacterium]